MPLPPVAPLPRLAVVLSHPTQYYSPWFRWLKSHTALEFRVFYLWEFGVVPTRDPHFQAEIKWDVDLLSGYESEFVPNVASRPGAEHFFGFNNPRLTARLSAWQPDAVLLFGYKWYSHLRTIAWARRRGVALIFRGDSHFLGRPCPAWSRRLPLQLLYRQFQAVTYTGAANRQYFETLGVRPERLFFAPHSVNHALYNPGDAGHRAAAEALRRQLNLPSSRRVILFAGKLVPAKQPLELLEAFLSLAPANAALVFIGEGEMKPALAALAVKAAPGTVHFLPFANQSEMPARYLLADVFALPSRGLYETWGLAVNEAMHMGVPCLVSDRVGSQQDLVTPGKTGWVFRAEDPADLRVQLDQALTSDLEGLRKNVAARIAGYTYAQTTQGLLAALAGTKPKRQAARS